MSKNNGHVILPREGFDFSHLYRTETVEVKASDGKVLFTAVVREITHGEKTEAQSLSANEIEFPTEGSKKSRERVLKQQMQSLDKTSMVVRTALSEEVSAIMSWTLRDASGNDVPVCVEAWRALPVSLAKQIEEAIERLSPELDDDFQNEP